MRDELLLYDLSDSPFCAKARICLQVKGLAYRRITLTVKNRKELQAANPLAKPGTAPRCQCPDFSQRHWLP